MQERMPVRRDLTYTILSVLFICLLIILTVWILRPFLVPLAWGSIVAVATWPLLVKLQVRLGNRRRLAILLMATMMLLTILIPTMLAALTIVKNAERITEKVKTLDTLALPSPPGYLRRVPLAGEKIANRWAAFTALSPEERLDVVMPYAQSALKWFAARAGNTGLTIVNFVLSMIITIIIYAKGETVREGLLMFAGRLAGRQGEEIAILAAKATRGVVLGVVLTALVQTAIGGIGLFLSGIPAAGLLTAVMLMFCLAQLGPLLILVPSVVWLYWSGHPVWGTVLLVFSIFAGTIDNFLRPFLIKKGADLPLLLIFAGIIGGLFAFGIIGLFIGPVTLGVAYTLLKAWVAGDVEETKAQ